MPADCTIIIDASDAAAVLGRLRSAAFARRATALAVGLGARRMREHFRKLNGSRSPNSNFYAREGAQKTLAEVDEDGGGGAVVVESYLIAHKLRGGTVRPVKARALAIPLTPWARRQGSPGKGIQGVFLAKTKSGNALLMRSTGDGKAEPAWVLKKSVRHRPRPETIPPLSEFAEDAAVAAAEIAAEI